MSSAFYSSAVFKGDRESNGTGISKLVWEPRSKFYKTHSQPHPPEGILKFRSSESIKFSKSTTQIHPSLGLSVIKYPRKELKLKTELTF